MLIFDMKSLARDRVRLVTRTRKTLDEILETLEVTEDPRIVNAVEEGIRDMKAGRVRLYREFAKELLRFHEL